MSKLMEVADAAQMIINGYAFTKEKDNIRVLNLNRPQNAAFISEQGEVLETSMNDIELDIILDYYRRNRKYMEG